MRTKGFRAAAVTRLCCVVAVCSCLAWWHQNFVTVPGKDVHRRAVAAALASQVLLQSAPAQAGDRDRASMVRAVRIKFLPLILEGYKKLQADKAVNDDFITGKKFKKFMVALDAYGSIQRLDEAPDKISRKLQADAKEVGEALKAKDYAKSMELLEVFRSGDGWCFAPSLWDLDCEMAATSSGTPKMSDQEKFFFDLNGFLHVRGALSKEEVERMNKAIDAHSGEIKEREDSELRNTRAGSALSGDGKTGRRDLGGMLGWPKPHCQPFREVLAHPNLLPYLVELCGPGYRMDHLPLVITSQKGSEGFHLHGGPLTQGGAFNPTLQYRCVNGQFYNSLLGVSVQLVDHRPGDGGFCVIRGSHKSNFPVPDDFLHGGGEEAQAHFYQPETRAGDVIFFSEATVHGAMAWTAEHERRIALYRFAPATVAYGAAVAGGLSGTLGHVARPFQLAAEDRTVSPVRAAVRTDSEAQLAVWIRLQEKLEAQCSELCASARNRDDDLIKRLDECLAGQASSLQESVRSLDSLIVAQRAQWQSIADQLTQHVVPQQESEECSTEPANFVSAPDPAPKVSVKMAENAEHPRNGIGRDALVAKPTWQEVSPPSIDQPAVLPGSLPEETEDGSDGQRRPSIGRRRNGSTVILQRAEKNIKDQEEEDMDEQKAYELAVARAERLLMLRACNLSRIEPPQKTWREKLKTWLESWWAEGLCAFVIFTNCIIIGVETDVVAQAVTDKSPTVFSVLDTFYTLIFFGELLVRLGAYGGSFFCGSVGLFWNYLDMLIVCPSMVQLAVRVIWQSDVEYGGSMTVVRVLRITRVFRVIRVVKVMKFVRSLRQLVESIMHTMKSLAWSMLLLVAIIYVFAIMFTDASVAYLVDNPTSALNSELVVSWGTLHASMHTLFRAVSGGFDWGGTAAALGDIHWAWMYLSRAQHVLP
ncbi:CATSPER1 [Symbiodinium pilosum]|uniref:CATSPER1 protein n=1 Tax=Symbiodinium pilosum TaxID=2952 RepID=A0A812VEF2_SYMPI|nr:CATSPER1 [Symbiodinium pilosum]